MSDVPFQIGEFVPQTKEAVIQNVPFSYFDPHNSLHSGKANTMEKKSLPFYTLIFDLKRREF